MAHRGLTRLYRLRALTSRPAQSLPLWSVNAAATFRQPSSRLQAPLPTTAAAAFRLCSTATATDGGGDTAAAVKEEHEFQAETRQLLDIVARSLYSEKEVFVRSVWLYQFC